MTIYIFTLYSDILVAYGVGGTATQPGRSRNIASDDIFGFQVCTQHVYVTV